MTRPASTLLAPGLRPTEPAPAERAEGTAPLAWEVRLERVETETPDARVEMRHLWAAYVEGHRAGYHLTKAEATEIARDLACDPEPVWQTNRTAWQHAQGVRRPAIFGDISPMQYGLMSKRAQARHDAERRAAWQASVDCGAEYERLCVEAYDADPSILTSPDLDRDAREAIRCEMSRRRDAEAARQRAERHAESLIHSTAEVAVGDRVWWVMRRECLTVTRVLKAAVRGVNDRGESCLARIGACRWPSDDEIGGAS